MTWRVMGTDNPGYKSTYNLLAGLLRTVKTGVLSTLDLQVPQTLNL